MKVFLTGRRGGKTTKAIAWVAEGERTKGYPGWTRVLVTATYLERERLRKEHWGTLEDVDHRVYDLDTWCRAFGLARSTEVCLDDFGLLHAPLYAIIPGTVTHVTMTGEPWEDS